MNNHLEEAQRLFIGHGLNMKELIKLDAFYGENLVTIILNNPYQMVEDISGIGFKTADKIAEHAEFFSFGTNDLSQMTFGFSRDDAGKFLNDYYTKNIFESDPFAKLDQNGVGQLVEMATLKGRSTRPDISLGICGEHGGEPSSVEFCHKIGLNYVSCSPFRVPLARLAAAQAAIKASEK